MRMAHHSVKPLGGNATLREAHNKSYCYGRHMNPRDSQEKATP
jgi:hypothetical protein